MSLFDSIKHAIFGDRPAAAATTSATATATVAPPPPVVEAAAATPAMTSDSLDSHLAALSARSAQKLNWQTSIVDLMKLVGLDPSLANRKQLAQELGYSGDTADSATMNVWLHREVMQKLAQSGGTVTPDLKA